MAPTFVWQDAIDYIRTFIKSIPTSTIDVQACNQTNSWMWRAYPWRWAQASLTSGTGVLTLSNGVQDYGIGTTTGAGFYQLLRVRVTRFDVSPVIANDNIDILQWLPPNLNTQLDGLSMSAIALEPVTSQLRLDSAASVSGSATYRIDGEYQFQPVKITATASVIVFPDMYFETVTECLKYKYYQLGDDPRAGGMVVDKATRRKTYSGQLAIAVAALQDMADNEGLGDGTPFRFPETSSFGVSRYGGGGGWFGY